MEYREQDIRAMVESVLQGLGAKASQPASAASCGSCCADPFPVEVSARHVHLTREAVELLFGPGHQLGKKKMLSQPGEFLSEERVKLVTPKGQIDNVAVLGPERKAVQVELSATDAKSLGLKAPVNLSGDLTGAADVVIIGPNGILKADPSSSRRRICTLRRRTPSITDCPTDRSSASASIRPGPSPSTAWSPGCAAIWRWRCTSTSTKQTPA